MATDKLSFDLLKKSASRAKAQASKLGIEKPLCEWQEFMATALGWSSFHEAGARLATAGTIKNDSGSGQAKSAPAATSQSKHWRGSIDAWTLKQIASRKYGYSMPGRELGEWLIEMSLQDQDFANRFASEPRKALGKLFEPESFQEAMEAAAKRQAATQSSLELARAWRAWSELFKPKGGSYPQRHSEAEMIAQQAIDGAEPEKLFPKEGVDIEELARLRERWISSAQELEDLLEFNPILAPAAERREAGSPAHLSPAHFQFGSSFEGIDEAWFGNEKIAAGIANLSRKNRFSKRPIRVGDLLAAVHHSANPFASIQEREIANDAARELLGCVLEFSSSIFCG